MTAIEALELTNNNHYKKDAIEYGIKTIESEIKEYATKGERSCIIRFLHHPGAYRRDFVPKYGEENKEHHKLYNVERELREYFTSQGFTFRLVTNDICGGVRQDPYWTICW